MAFRSKFRPFIFEGHRQLSTSILSPDSKSSFTIKEKSRAALAFLRFEKNPERILEICRAADLTPESPMDRIAYSKAISKLKESHCYDGIRSFIRESVARSESRTERCISRFVVLYGQAGLVGDAIELFDQMPEMGIDRNVKTLNSLLFSCILAEDYGEMKRLFEEFPSKYGLESNLDTYNTVLKGFCDSGSANLSHKILSEMKRKGIKPNGKTFATVLAGLYTEEKFQDVGKIMELMRSYGILPGISIYNVRIQSLCKLKRSNEAKALLTGILCQGMKPNSATFGHLIYGFCREGKLDVAKNLFKEMIDKGLKPEAECYFTLIYYLCQGSDFEVALNICEEAMGNGWVPNFTTMKSLVDGLARIGKIAEAKKIIRLVKEKFSRNADKWKEIEEGSSYARQDVKWAIFGLIILQWWLLIFTIFRFTSKEKPLDCCLKRNQKATIVASICRQLFLICHSLFWEKQEKHKDLTELYALHYAIWKRLLHHQTQFDSAGISFSSCKSKSATSTIEQSPGRIPLLLLFFLQESVKNLKPGQELHLLEAVSLLFLSDCLQLSTYSNSNPLKYSISLFRSDPMVPHVPIANGTFPAISS